MHRAPTARMRPTVKTLNNISALLGHPKILHFSSRLRLGAFANSRRPAAPHSSTWQKAAIQKNVLFAWLFPEDLGKAFLPDGDAVAGGNDIDRQQVAAGQGA